MTKKDSKKSLRPGSKSARSTASKRRSASRKAGSKSSRSAKSSKSAKSRKAKSSKGPSSKSGRKSGSASSKKSTSASRRQKKSLGAGLATAVDKSNKSDKEKCKTAVCPSDKETKVDVAAQAKELQDKVSETHFVTLIPPDVFKVGGAAPKTVEMRMQPAELVWKQNGGVKQVHIVNNSKERRAVKVKCTDNLLYRVHPVCGFVDPGESYKVEVLRNNGSTKSDVLLFMTTKAGEQKEARECFADKAQQNEMLVLPMLPEKDDVAV
ncbi:unnamed protein product, partial [Mesorhabditis spiculigera]